LHLLGVKLFEQTTVLAPWPLVTRQEWVMTGSGRGKLK